MSKKDAISTKALETLRSRLAEAEDMLSAIRAGEVDAIVVDGQDAPAVYTLKGATEPYRLLVEQMSEGALTISSNGVILYCNAAFARMIARQRERLVGASIANFVVGEDGASIVRLLAHSAAGGLAVRLKADDGSVKHTQISAAPMTVAGEAAHCLVVTDLSRQELRVLHEATVNASADAIYALRLDGTIKSWNAGAEHLYGYKAQEAIGGNIRMVFPPEQPVNIEKLLQSLTAGRSERVEAAAITKSGGKVEIALSLSPIPGADGRVSGVAAIARDITQRKLTERALRASEAYSRSVFEASPDCLEILSLDGRLEGMNENGRRLLQIDSLDVVRGKYWPDLWPPEARGQIEAALTDARAGRGAHVSGFCPTARGEAKWWDVMVTAVLDGDGSPVRLVAASRDVTERKRAEEALAESEARYSALFANETNAIAHCRVIMNDERVPVDYRILRVNGAYERIVGIKKADIEGRSVKEVFPGVENYEFDFIGVLGKIGRDGGELLTEAFLEETGQYISLYAYSPLPGEFTAIFTDVSDRKRTEQALVQLNADLERRVNEEVEARAAAQEQLAQSEKLSALGQLAGGVAHDFNNIIQVVSGGASQIRRHLEDPSKVQRLSQMIMDSALRGASVTRRLLAFARRNELQAEPIDVASLLEGLCEVLSHTLGASFSVRLEVAPGLPPAMADRSQLETVLVNLATNARDAMAMGGAITIKADRENVSKTEGPPILSPGAYIRFVVADRGTGMDKATLAKAPQAFFTTKSSGVGTGLGLPMARGFAEQSGGALEIESEPGRGTTVTLWLPISHGDKPGLTRTANVAIAPPAETNRILLVDDNDTVREVLAGELADLGYQVVHAANGVAALALLDSGEAFEVIVSDLAMPVMDGLALIREAQKRAPRLRAILVTGFADETATFATANSASFSLLRKPVSGLQLAENIAALLETSPGR